MRVFRAALWNASGDPHMIDCEEDVVCAAGPRVSKGHVRATIQSTVEQVAAPSVHPTIMPAAAAVPVTARRGFGAWHVKMMLGGAVLGVAGAGIVTGMFGLTPRDLTDVVGAGSGALLTAVALKIFHISG